MGRDKGSRGKMPLSGLQKKLTKKERWLLRTGNMPSKAERSIVLLRARRRGESERGMHKKIYDFYAHNVCSA